MTRITRICAVAFIAMIGWSSVTALAVYQTGMNLYQYGDSLPLTGVDWDALRKLHLKIGIGADGSASAWDPITKKNIKGQLGGIQHMLNQCKTAGYIDDDIEIDRGIDKRMLQDPGHDYHYANKNDADLAYNSLKTIAEDNQGATWVILVTNRSIYIPSPGGPIGAVAVTDEDGTVWNAGFGDSENTLAHELGHYVGYDGGDEQKGIHSSDPNNVMFKHYPGGPQPDKCWCKKLDEFLTNHQQ